MLHSVRRSSRSWVHEFVDAVTVALRFVGTCNSLIFLGLAILMAWFEKIGYSVCADFAAAVVKSAFRLLSTSGRFAWKTRLAHFRFTAYLRA